MTERFVYGQFNFLFDGCTEDCLFFVGYWIFMLGQGFFYCDSFTDYFLLYVEMTRKNIFVKATMTRNCSNFLRSQYDYYQIDILITIKLIFNRLSVFIKKKL